MNITAQNEVTLLKILQETEISMPSRGIERTNEHVERCSIARLLATLASIDSLVYPLSTKKRERPDYLVMQGVIQAGFELTEAINPQHIQAQLLPEATEEQSIVDAGYFKWGNKYTLNKLRDISSRRRLTASPWMGNDVEQEYANMIKDVVQKKTKKLNKTGFTRYTENNLLIDVSQRLPMLQSGEAMELCNAILRGYWGENSFDNVYVECHSELHHYRESQISLIPLNNLWQ